MLKLEVTGSAKPNLTLEVDDDRTKEKPAKLPWRRTFEFPTGSGTHEWNLKLGFDGGDLRARAYVNGQLFGQSEGGGDGEGMISLEGSFSD